MFSLVIAAWVVSKLCKTQHACTICKAKVSDPQTLCASCAEWADLEATEAYLARRYFESVTGQPSWGSEIAKVTD